MMPAIALWIPAKSVLLVSRQIASSYLTDNGSLPGRERSPFAYLSPVLWLRHRNSHSTCHPVAQRVGALKYISPFFFLLFSVSGVFVEG